MQGRLGDRYELGRVLGSGGMGVVYEAQDRVLDRRVAVKVLRADLLEPRARQRFEREARMAAQLSHPNTVAVHDFGKDGDRQFIVMELIEGPSLADMLRESGSLSVPEVLQIADQLLAGLAAAHTRELVHRDIKPSNVLLGRDGVVKLSDFGIAKPLSSAVTNITSTGVIVGTFRYMAPEQAFGGPATRRSDIYSVGAVLYELLAGDPPFSDDSPMALALAHRQSRVPPLGERCPIDVPRWLAALIERALSKDPTDRYSDAAEMRSALTAARENASATSEPPRQETQSRPVASRSASLADRLAEPCEFLSAEWHEMYPDAARLVHGSVSGTMQFLTSVPHDHPSAPDDNDDLSFYWVVSHGRLVEAAVGLHESPTARLDFPYFGAVDLLLGTDFVPGWREYFLSCDGDLAFIGALDEMPTEPVDVLAWTTIPEWLQRELERGREGAQLPEPSPASRRLRLLNAAVAARARELGLPLTNDEPHEQRLRDFMSSAVDPVTGFNRYWQEEATALPSPTQTSSGTADLIRESRRRNALTTTSDDPLVRQLGLIVALVVLVVLVIGAVALARAG